MSTSTDLAVSAYLYYYPLVENLHQVQRYVTTGVGTNPAAPFNSFSHARTLAGPQDTFVTINNDTLYSMAQLDLSVGPVKLEVPDTGDRYYVLQFVDAWTNNIAYVGTRATGNRAGSFLIVPPGWTGEVPAGVTVIPASTRVLSIVGRFACAGPDDVAEANAVQDAVVLEPLDADAPEPLGIPVATGAAGTDETFWEEAKLFSQAFPAPAEESDIVAAFDPAELRDAALAEAKEKLEYLTHHGSSATNNGWVVGIHLFDYNAYALGPGTIDDDAWKIADPTTRIAERAIACRLGLWGNHGYEAVYAQAFTDANGAPLEGEGVYAIRFETPPPVGAFWSVTLYDIPDYFLVENPIDRYSLGDRTPGIVYDDDKTLTVVVSHTEPTEVTARANWLPAPAVRFRLVLRLYIPGAAVLDGSYAFPFIRRVDV